jgi:putative transposase
MVCKLGLSVENGLLKIRGFRLLADVINGVKCIDSKDVETVEHHRYIFIQL